jgi:hypothetical protein
MTLALKRRRYVALRRRSDLVRKRVGVLAAVGSICTLILLTASPAFAGSITGPLCGPAPGTVCTPANPYQALTDVNSSGVGTPRFFTITGTGYTPQGTNVVLEVCDGTPPTTAGWDPTLNCDVLTAPAAAIADANGSVTFAATDTNRRLKLFDGLGPNSLFNCVRADEPDPGNGFPTFGIPGTAPCQVRMSTNNTVGTTDQAFFSFALIRAPQVPEAPYAILLPAGALLLFGGGYVVTRRRRSSQASA